MAKTETNLKKIVKCFKPPFKMTVKTNDIVKETGLSRKVVWKTLKDALDKNPLAKKAIRQPKKGVYEIVSMEDFNKLLGELKAYTFDELVEIFKQLETLSYKSGKTELQLTFTPLTGSLILEKFRAKQISGILIWETSLEEEKQRFLKRLEPLKSDKLPLLQK